MPRKLPSFLSQSKFHWVANDELHRLMTTIRNSPQASKIVINGMPLHEYLGSITNYREDRNSIPNLVKGCILKAGGITGNPEELPEDTTVSDIIDSSPKYVALQNYLNAVVKHFKPSAVLLTRAEVEGCDSVKDCIDLVTERIA